MADYHMKSLDDLIKEEKQKHHRNPKPQQKGFQHKGIQKKKPYQQDKPYQQRNPESNWHDNRDNSGRFGKKPFSKPKQF